MTFFFFFCYSDDEVTWKKIFPVYPLPLLFKNLKNKCYAVIGYRGEPIPNDAIAISELNYDTYNFEVQYACKVCFVEQKPSITY